MSDTNPLDVAVIIPAYNQAPYLEEAVRSVMRQSQPVAQVIVVDDGSTDDTTAVAQKLVQEFSILTLLTQKNAGVAEACRAGLEKVTTAFVLRLDADDWIPENFVAELYQLLYDAPAEVAFSYSDARLFGTKDGWIKAGPWSVARIIPENYIHVSSLVRTAAVKEVGYFNPSMKGGFEDWDFYLRLIEAGYRGVYCRSTHLWYRQKDDGGRNTMTREQERSLRAQIEANHPTLYQQPINQGRIFLWRIHRRLKHWVGRA